MDLAMPKILKLILSELLVSILFVLQCIMTNLTDFAGTILLTRYKIFDSLVSSNSQVNSFPS